MQHGRTSDTLEWAILQTIVYADIFSYPLTLEEIQYYLIGCTATCAEVTQALQNLQRNTKIIVEQDSYYTLCQRVDTVDLRKQRAQIATDLWSPAVKYGRLIGQLPFVRMVAATGSLAVDNTESTGDIDYLIVTEPGRLWLCRLFIIGLVKWVQQRDGFTLCPNYIISEDALEFQERNLFTAREIAQMVPVAGEKTYQNLLDLNQWIYEYLPNANGHPPTQKRFQSTRYENLKHITEIMMRTPPGDWLDRLEMNRKIKKLTHQNGGNQEAAFSRDWCKGHFDGHQRRILEAFDKRLDLLVENQQAVI